jgi:hypothetical protein
MRAIRGILIAVGAATVLYGIYEAWQTVPPSGLTGLVRWLVLALIIHDGIIGMTVLGVCLVVRKYGKQVPVGVLAVIQVGLITGLVLSFIAVLAIAAKAAGTRNPTVLPLDYATNLAWVWGGVAVVTAAACALVLLVGRRRAATVRGS